MLNLKSKTRNKETAATVESNPEIKGTRKHTSWEIRWDENEIGENEIDVRIFGWSIRCF